MSAAQITRAWRTFWRDQDGVTAIEYALLAALIFAVIVASVTLAGTNLAALYNAIAGLIPPP